MYQTNEALSVGHFGRTAKSLGSARSEFRYCFDSNPSLVGLMSLRSLCELLEEGLEAVNSNGFFSGCDVLLENIEIVLSELNRYDSSQTLNNAISYLRRGCQLIQSLTERQGEPSTGRPRLQIPRYSLRYLLLTLNFKVTDISARVIGILSPRFR